MGGRHAFLAFASFLFGSAFANGSLQPRAKSIDIFQIIKFLLTETEDEFDLLSLTETENRTRDIWRAATEHEWERAESYETNDGRASPFIVCHDGDNMSGWQRKNDLLGAINTTDDVILYTIYSGDDFYCSISQLAASVAAAIEGDDLYVQPLTMSMKLLAGTVQHLLDRIDEADDGDDEDGVGGNETDVKEPFPSLTAFLCPGVLAGNTPNTQAAELQTQEYTDEVTAFLLDRSGTDNTSAVSEAVYFTSTNATAELNEADELPPRAAFWKSIFALHNSGECDDTYSNRLTWTLSRASDPETSLSVLRVEYNNTGAVALDRACMFSLVAAVGTDAGVCGVEIKRVAETRNVNAQWLVQSGIEDVRPWFDSGLTGKGQVVALSDTGVDSDNCYFWDRIAAPPNYVQDNSGHRKLVQYRPYVDSSDYKYGHGTHVAGTIAGRRATNGDDETTGKADGVARDAKLAFIDIGFDDGSLRVPDENYLLDTGREGSGPRASIHSASWGSPVNYYSSQAKAFDNYMYENDDFLIVVAAGNSGDGDTPNTVGDPATFKNGIAVGASHSYGDDLGSRDLGPSYIASFSSRGPTRDGRTKPDIVAPGKYILSAGARPSETGECDGDTPGAGGSKEGLLSLMGTSMATPVVSGTAAQIRQYFMEGWYPSGTKKTSDAIANPSGALVKAVLLNGAQYMNGVDNGKKVTSVEPYDNTQNFGRISLIDSLYIVGKSNIQAKVWDRQSIDDRMSQTYDVTVDKSNGCTSDLLSVTLVWVERGSASGCTRCQLNDLDLSVEKNGDSFRFPNGRSGKDNLNSAERVQFDDAADGDIFTIQVEAYNLEGPSQTYALVATGCFGGVANTLDTSEDVFANDDSADDRKTKRILIIVFSSLGVVLLFCACGYFARRREKGSQELNQEREDENEGGGEPLFAETGVLSDDDNVNGA